MTERQDPSAYSSETNPSQPYPGTPAPYDPSAPQGSSGQYGQYGQYGQPASPSQPYQGTPSQPYQGAPFQYQGTPSQPYGSTYGQAYGQPASPSQPYQGNPSQPYQGTPSQPYPGPSSQPLGSNYGQPGAPSQPFGSTYGQPGPVSQPFYGQQTLYPEPTPPKNRRGLKIALIVGAIALVLAGILGGGAIFAINTFTAPASAAQTFCNDLKAQNYDSAYGLLSAQLQSTYSSDAFRSGVAALDGAEGKVIACQRASGNNSYVYSFGASTATVGAQLTRAIQGNLVGSIHMKNEKGSWKVDSIDTSLLGVNMSALQAAETFCSAMQGKNYAAAYALLDSSQQQLATQADFVASGQLHDAIDGTVSKCALVKVPQGNTDQLTHLTIDLTRSHLGDRSGDITLKYEGSDWKIDATDAALGGTNLQPLVVGAQFCALFGAAKYADAYKLFSSTFQSAVSQDLFVSLYSSYGGETLAWACGTPDYSTYSVSSNTASVVIPMTLSIPSLGATAQHTDNYKVEFVVENGAWKIDDVIFQ